jgi:hypothetical protein
MSTAPYQSYEHLLQTCLVQQSFKVSRSFWRALHPAVSGLRVATMVIIAGRAANALVKHAAEVVQAGKAASGGGFAYRHGTIDEQVFGVL